MLAEIRFPDGRTQLYSYLPNGCFAFACNSTLDLVNVDD